MMLEASLDAASYVELRVEAEHGEPPSHLRRQRRAEAFSSKLFRRGISPPALRWPTVAEKR